MYKMSLIFSLFHVLLLWFSFTGHKNILKAFSYRFICNLCLLNLFFPVSYLLPHQDGSPRVAGLSRGGTIWSDHTYSTLESPLFQGAAVSRSRWHRCLTGHPLGLVGTCPSSPSLIHHTGGKRGEKADRRQGWLPLGEPQNHNSPERLSENKMENILRNLCFMFFSIICSQICPFPLGKLLTVGSKLGCGTQATRKTLNSGWVSRLRRCNPGNKDSIYSHSSVWRCRLSNIIMSPDSFPGVELEQPL